MRAAVGKWQKEEVRDGLAAGVGVEEQRAMRKMLKRSISKWQAKSQKAPWLETPNWHSPPRV